MRIYFEVTGNDLSKANIHNTYIDYLSFEDENGNEYCIDLIGEFDFSFSKKEISGRFKGDFEVLRSNLSKEDMIDKIMNMNKSSFELGLFIEPEEDNNYSSVKARIEFGDKFLEIE